MAATKSFTDFEFIRSKVGITAARVWYWLNTNETTKASGPKGAIVLTPAEVAKGVGQGLDATHADLIALIKNGWARYDQGMVKAA